MAAEILDPVCGMHLNPTIAPFEFRHGDDMYYFCSDRCYRTFRDDPESYANPEIAGRAGVDAVGEECLIPGGAEGCR
jgi:YHS domain-containing protein